MNRNMPIPADTWWRCAGDQFDKVVREALSRAQAAEQKETGHECGHQWTIAVECVGHSSIAGEGPESHRDAGYSDTFQPVTVRAHNLRDALLLAAARPTSEWLDASPDVIKEDA